MRGKGLTPSPPVIPPAQAGAAVRRLIPLALPVYCGGPRGHYVALTFDDGPGPYTHLALRKLRFFHDRATFFLVGKVLPVDPGAPRQEAQVGTVADHTWTHPVLPALSPDQIHREIANTKAAVTRASGGAPVTLFRPPYGARTTAIDRQARALGLLEILWSVDSLDSAGANYAGISANVISGLKPGAIILMHENRGQTIRALLTILPALRRRHLRAVTVPELLALDPPSLRQLREGPAGCARSSASSASLTGGG